MADQTAAELAKIITTITPLKKRGRETKEGLLDDMVKHNKTELRSGNCVFTVKRVKKAPQAITLKRLKPWYDAFMEDREFDIDDFIDYIQSTRAEQVEGMFKNVLRVSVAE